MNLLFQPLAPTIAPTVTGEGFPVRRIFFCSCNSPYSSASAVGGQPGT